MDEKEKRKKKRIKSIFKFFEALFVFFEMMLSLNCVATLEDEGTIKITLCVIYAMIGLADVSKAARLGREEGVMFKKFVLLGVLYLAGAVLMIVLGGTKMAIAVAYYVYAISMLLSRVSSIVQNHKKYNVLINIFRILPIFIVFLFPSILFVETEETGNMPMMMSVILLVFIWLQSLIRLIGISLSEIKFHILKHIIEKSMAVQILSGLVLLIISFSYVFEMTEESIKTYGDGLWYCFAIVTTIGFGDMTATGALGRILSVILGIYGIIVVSLITSIIINFYSETKDIKTSDDDGDNDGENGADTDNFTEEKTDVEQPSEEEKAPDPVTE